MRRGRGGEEEEKENWGIWTEMTEGE